MTTLQEYLLGILSQKLDDNAYALKSEPYYAEIKEIAKNYFARIPLSASDIFECATYTQEDFAKFAGETYTYESPSMQQRAKILYAQDREQNTALGSLFIQPTHTSASVSAPELNPSNVYLVLVEYVRSSLETLPVTYNRVYQLKFYYNTNIIRDTRSALDRIKEKNAKITDNLSK